MDYVYVVTVSGRGSEVGGFAGTPTAFEQLVSARAAAKVCRDALGSRFVPFEAESLGDHVVQRWDSDEFSVWLERLIFEPEL